MVVFALIADLRDLEAGWSNYEIRMLKESLNGHVYRFLLNPQESTRFELNMRWGVIGFDVRVGKHRESDA